MALKGLTFPRGFIKSFMTAFRSREDFVSGFGSIMLQTNFWPLKAALSLFLDVLVVGYITWYDIDHTPLSTYEENNVHY